MTLEEALELSRQGPFDDGYAKAIWMSGVDGKCLVLKSGSWRFGFILYKRITKDFFRWNWHRAYLHGGSLDWQPVMPQDKILKETARIRKELGC